MFILNLLSQHRELLAYALLLWAFIVAVALAAITGSKKIEQYVFALSTGFAGLNRLREAV